MIPNLSDLDPYLRPGADVNIKRVSPAAPAEALSPTHVINPTSFEVLSLHFP